MKRIYEPDAKRIYERDARGVYPYARNDYGKKSDCESSI